jgi:glycosyltransferase involved in cell wall biosynthesis
VHVLWKFNRRPCEKPQCLPCTLTAKRPPQLWRYTGLLERASQHVDQFVSPSRFTARMHAERGFPEPFAHLPHFIDRADRDWQAPGPRPHEGPYFLFVGRLETVKGLHTLVDVWPRTRGVDLLIAGAGDEERRLRAQAATNPRIKFLGAVPQHRLGPLYFHAQACIVPSVAYETFGVVVIEAFARKTPAIVRDRGALPEVIQESGGGFVYRTDAELLDAIARLAGSPELRAELGENGYRAVVEKWSKEAHLRAYFDLLRQVAIRKLGSVPWESDGSEASHEAAPLPLPRRPPER